MRSHLSFLSVIGLCAALWVTGCGESAGDDDDMNATGTGGSGSGGTTGASGAGGTSAAGSGGSSMASGSGGVVGGAGSGGAPSNEPTCPMLSRTDTQESPDITRLVDAFPFGVTLLGIADGYVYFIQDSMLKRMAPTGGEPETVSAKFDGYVQLVGTDTLLWIAQPETDDGPYRLMTAPLSDPEDTTAVAETMLEIEYLDADADHVYWSTRQPADIYRAPRAGGKAEVFVAGGSPLGSLIHDGYYWWLDFETESLERIALSGGMRERLTEVHFGGPMAGDADGVYWGDTSLKTIEKWTAAGGRQGLASADPDDVTVVDGVVYWTDGFVSGSVRSIRTDGTEPRSLLCGLGSPDALFVDGDAVIVNSSEGITRIELH